MNAKNTILRRALPLALCTTAAVGTLVTPQQAQAAGAVDILVDIGVSLFSLGIEGILGMDSSQDGYGTLSEETLLEIADIVDASISDAFLTTHLASAQSTVEQATLYSCVTTDCVDSCAPGDDECQECDTYAECATKAGDIQEDANDDSEQLEELGLPGASWYGTMSALEVAYLREWRANETSTDQRDKIDDHLETMSGNAGHLETMLHEWNAHEYAQRQAPFDGLIPHPGAAYNIDYDEDLGWYWAPGLDMDDFYLIVSGDAAPLRYTGGSITYVNNTFEGYGTFSYSFDDGGEPQEYSVDLPCTEFLAFNQTIRCSAFDLSARTTVADQVRDDFEAMIEEERNAVLGAAYGDMINELTYVGTGTSYDGSRSSTQEFCSLYDGETIALSTMPYTHLFTVDGAMPFPGSYPAKSQLTVSCDDNDEIFRLSVEGKQIFATQNNGIGTVTTTGARTKWTAWLQDNGTWAIRSQSQDAYIDMVGASAWGVPGAMLGLSSSTEPPELIPHTFNTGRFQVTVLP